MASYTSQPIDHVPSRPETAISRRLSYVSSTYVTGSFRELELTASCFAARSQACEINRVLSRELFRVLPTRRPVARNHHFPALSAQLRCHVLRVLEVQNKFGPSQTAFPSAGEAAHFAVIVIARDPMREHSHDFSAPLFAISERIAENNPTGT